MHKIVLAATVAVTILASVLPAAANSYIDPRAPFDGARFFNSIPTGQ